MKNIKNIVPVALLLINCHTVLCHTLSKIVPADAINFAKKYQGTVIGHPLLDNPLKNGKPLIKECSLKEKNRLIMLWENKNNDLHEFYKNDSNADPRYKTKKGIAPIDQDILLLTKIHMFMLR